jgi:hypothetical protein
MKLELISNNTAIRITSTLFTSNNTKTYTITVNDGTPVAVVNANVVNNSYYDYTITLAEGVHSVVLKQTVTATSVITLDKGCIFKNIETGCKVAKQLASGYNQQLATTYFVLVTAADKCVDCDDLKVLYNSMDYGDCEFC